MSEAAPVPGYSGIWWIEEKEDVGVGVEDEFVPLP
jgi:hypothetical protein